MIFNLPTISIYTVTVTPFQQNCTIIACNKTKRCAVVDPGGDVDRILAETQKQGLTVEKIWVTHGHLDHCGGVQALKDVTGVPIEGPHKEDQFLIEAIPVQAAEYGITGMQTFKAENWLDEGDVVQMGETSWQVFYCPGHTPGHVIFYNKKNNFAQVGDVLFKGSIGRTDFPRGDHATLIRSITQKLWPLGDVAFVPGHGPNSTFGEERQQNPYVADSVLKVA